MGSGRQPNPKCHDSVTVIAIDLGGTKVAAAVVDESGVILARRQELLGGRRGSEVAALVADQCRALVEAHSAARRVGVIVPGIYHGARGSVWAPNIPDWDDYPLRDELHKALADVEIVIDSDRAGYILGETWRGAAAGARNAIFLAVGTGIGAGILVDGRIVRGAGDIAGAIGWLALDRPYRDAYARCGCFEYHASGPGLTIVSGEALAARSSYDGELDGHALSVTGLIEAYDHGDVIARETLDDAVQFWGMATANLVSLFNPETIVFGGGVFGPATRFLDRIGAEARRWGQPIAMQQVRLVASALGGDAGLYGAARLAGFPHIQSP